MARSSPFTRALLSLSEHVGNLNDQDEPKLAEVEKVVSDTRRIVVQVLNDLRFSDEIPREMRQNLTASLSRLT